MMVHFLLQRDLMQCMQPISYQQASKDFGLTVSIPKTKHMVTGRLVEPSDIEPIVLDGAWEC